jgi:hypothetical protein
MECVDEFSLKSEVCSFMKIHPMEVSLLHADGRTDVHEANRRCSQLLFGDVQNRRRLLLLHNIASIYKTSHVQTIPQFQ